LNTIGLNGNKSAFGGHWAGAKLGPMVGAWGAAWQEHNLKPQSLNYSHMPIVIIRHWFLWLYPKIRAHGFQNPYSKARLWNISAMLKPAAKALWLPITATPPWKSAPMSTSPVLV
jgi:hypothetical protein